MARVPADHGESMFRPQRPVVATLTRGGLQFTQPRPISNPGTPPGLPGDLTRDLPDTYTTQYG